jgi:hypothetical protein
MIDNNQADDKIIAVLNSSWALGFKVQSNIKYSGKIITLQIAID